MSPEFVICRFPQSAFFFRTLMRSGDLSKGKHSAPRNSHCLAGEALSAEMYAGRGRFLGGPLVLLMMVSRYPGLGRCVSFVSSLSCNHSLEQSHTLSRSCSSRAVFLHRLFTPLAIN